MKYSFFNGVLRVYSFIFLSLFVLSTTFAQRDSLASKSFKQLEDLYLSAMYVAPEKAKTYADALYLESLKGIDSQRIAKALYRKGYINFKLGNTQKAHEFTEASLKITIAINNRELLLQNYTQKGNINLASGNYKKAIEHYINAKQIAKNDNFTRDVFVLTYNIGLVKKQIEDYPGALEDFKKNLDAIAKLKSSNYNRLEVQNCLALADTYLRIEKTDSAKIYTNSGLLKAPKDTFLELFVDLSLNKVIILFQEKNYQESIDFISSLEKSIEKIGCNQKMVTSYLYLGKNYLELHKHDKAIGYFEKIKDLIYIQDFSFPELEEVYYYLAKMYFHQGNTEKANENFELFEDFTKNNNLSNKKVQHTIKDYDIATLKSELLDLNLQHKQQKKTVNYLYALACILAISIFIFWILYKRYKHKNSKQFEALQAYIKKIETTSLVKQKTQLAIDDEGVVQIIKDLDKFEEKQYFLNVDCNLSYAAKKLKTNTAYLSHVINTHKGKSFSKYITELRINAALLGLKNDAKIRKYTMAAIANEFGFKRRETFYRVFKNITGIHPTNYIKELEKEQRK